MANTYTNLIYHVVFSTKNRFPYLISRTRPEFFRYVGGVIIKHKGTPIAINGVEDHIHILAGFGPTIAVSEMIRNIKGGSSFWLNENGKLPEHFGWQEGYAAFSVSHSLVEKVKKYVLNQEKRHRRLSAEDEWNGLLQKHGIECFVPEP